LEGNTVVITGHLAAVAYKIIKVFAEKRMLHYIIVN